ncbi:helix-turn-helix transcriptional regulator [Agromyces sp. MMS24-JH15]|uniref:helix-turn-helix transcriptional regulator n=1 Tax=Agromyces sp. MMS24-JH15 TaxID=3243765 RepID=UPI00374969C5
MLQTRRDWPGSLLASRLQVSDRTVRRDIDRLRELGYAIEATMGPDGGYRLDAGSQLPPLLFDDDQAVALAVALQAAIASGAGVEEDALRALATVRQVMPSRLRHRLDSLAFTTLATGPGEAPAPASTASTAGLLEISAAIRAREVLRFDYATPTRTPATGEEARPPLRVEPHHLVVLRGRWYLVAWDLGRDDWRIFRADRISARTPTGPRFTPRALPGADVAEFVSARFKGSDHVDAWPCIGRVILHRPASDVEPFSGDGIVRPLGPDRCSLEVGSWSWVSLAAALNRFDADVDVVEPVELRDAFAVLAERNAATAAAAPR